MEYNCEQLDKDIMQLQKEVSTKQYTLYKIGYVVVQYQVVCIWEIKLAHTYSELSFSPLNPKIPSLNKTYNEI